MGSFLACAIERTINHRNWIYSRSVCEHCGHQLGLFDLIPVFSFLFLKGRCRYCQEKIGWVYPASELSLGMVYVLTFLVHGDFGLSLWKDLILFSLFFCISLYDLSCLLIPDCLIVLGIMNWMICSLMLNGCLRINDMLEGFLLAMMVYLLALFMNFRNGKENLGGGDVKLLFLIGLHTGYLKGVMVLLMGSVMGLIVMLVKREKKIPFGPFLCFGCFVMILYGDVLFRI